MMKKSEEQIQRELQQIPQDKLKRIFDSLTPKEKKRAAKNAMKALKKKMNDTTLEELAKKHLQKKKPN